MTQVSRILVRVAGTDADADAIRFACGIAKRSKAQVYAVYVIEVKRTLPLDAAIDPEIQHSEELLDRAERVAEDEGIEIQTQLLQAREAGAAIVDEAVERNAQVIIMAGMVVVALATAPPDPSRTGPLTWTARLSREYDDAHKRPWYARLSLWFGVYAVIWVYLYWRFW